MAEWLFTFWDTIYYINSNFSCLLSSIEFLTSKIIILFSYIDLLVDLSESFSVMIVLSVLISSALTILIHTHSLNSTSNSSFNKYIYSLSYNMYVKYAQFRNRL